MTLEPTLSLKGEGHNRALFFFSPELSLIQTLPLDGS